MNTSYNVATVFKSLGEETRLSIVRVLARESGEANSRDIIVDCSVALKLSQPTMSHHFQTLVGAGVILERKVGVEKFYRLNKELFKTIGINARKI